MRSDFATDADRAACRAMIRTGSKSFFAASLLLPARVRTAAIALYAFCRLSDDLVDVEGGSADAIARLRSRLALAYAGRPADNSVDRAFADVVVQFGLPSELPEALIEGLEWDVGGVACEELGDVQAYAARVAGSVGAMMTVLMGVRCPKILARACDLGVAMQLTNIARDVGEDARNGRLYLPRSWLREEGIDPDAWLAAPVFSPSLGRVVMRLLRSADRLYRRAESGIAGLPASCRPAIFAARHIYAAIGGQIAQAGYDSVTNRAHVPAAAKLRLMGRALFDAVRIGQAPLAPAALPQTQYLVDAVAVSPVPAPALRRISDRLLWVAALFVSLGERERLRA
ncbi:MAG: phytoene/squalene synthase family protein [Rhizomicrobium sp.]